MAYIRYPVEVSPNEIAQSAYSYLKNNIPGWQPNTGNLDTIMLEAMSLEAAIVRELTGTVSDAIFRYFGASMMNIQPIEASFAQVDSTWVAADSVGHTIPTNTQVGIYDTLGQLQLFVTTTDVTIPPGSSSTASGAVPLEALAPGVAASNIGGPGATAQLIDVLEWMGTITLVGYTAGGVDAESDDDYLNRLVDQLSLLSTRPILPPDFEIWARSVAGVGRAMAIDNYNPNDSTYGNERMITVAVVDTAGNAVSGPTKTAVDNLLEAQREVNFVVWVIDPTYTQIDVTYNVIMLTGQDPTTIVATVNAALVSYLDPSVWGRDFSDSPTWRNISKVYYLEIAQVINNVQGVDRINTMTIGIHGSAMGTTDVTLAGVAPLPRVGTITGTAS